jgi:tRNA (cytidine/uridine-2'-O-)-methyltransferase
MFHVVLVHPQIPPNTGNVIRLAANTGCTLHLVEPLGFSMEDRLLRRAGLDYQDYASVRRHASGQRWLDDERPDPARCFAFSRNGPGDFRTVRWRPGDWLVFGSETAGLPQDLRALWPAAQWLRLPMLAAQRSLNLSNAVAVAVFEAWRQNGYAGSG